MPPRTGKRRVRVPTPNPSLPDASDDDEASSDSSHKIVGNYPDAIPTKAKGQAEDVNYFYDRTVPGKLVYCKVCR
jgi:hypothetical protein